VPTYAHRTRAPPHRSQAHSALPPGLPRLRPPPTTILDVGPCGLHRRRLGWLPRHTTLHLRLCCIFGRQPRLLGRQTSARRLPLQRRDRPRPLGCASSSTSSTTPSSAPPLSTATTSAPSTSPPTPYTSAHEACGDRPPLCPGACRSRRRLGSQRPHNATVRRHLHQGPAIQCVPRLSLQSQRLSRIEL
jgi:hypothetical protein